MSRKSSARSRRPRRPEPFFRTQTRSWYVQIQGRQIPLGNDETLAWVKYDELVKTSDCKFIHACAVVLLDEFLEHIQGSRSKSTYKWYLHYLRSFVGHIGRTIRVSELRPFHVTQWLETQFAELSGTSRNCAVRAVKAAFNWAVTEGHLSVSPFRSVKRPPAGRREIVLTADEFAEKILGHASDERERDLLQFLWETGARVQEIRRIAREHVNLARGQIVLRPSEDKSKHYRVIYLTEVAREIIERLSKEFPDGPLFRNRRGKPWTSNAIRCRFRKFHLPGMCGTVLRHSFCQRLLTSGVDSLTVAELMGHRDLTMVARTYGHLAHNPAFLHTQLNRAT